MRHWLMKTEPDTFSFDDLIALPRRTTRWEGVRNYQARNMMRDEFKKGDLVLVYHSSCPEPGVAGLGEVVREAHPDLTALDPKSPYFDEKSARDGESRWLLVDVKGTHRLTQPVSLAAMRGIAGLEDMLVLKKGMRLSIQAVTPAEWKIITRLGKPEPV
jgi:predicted RNA-binding protein with PUA-like domain